MVQIAWPTFSASHSRPTWHPFLVIVLLAVWVSTGSCMPEYMIRSLRDDTRHLFYHGYDNYMAHAFPDDELKPLSCLPQTRNRFDPTDIGLNDVLGNYSVTLVDTLSTLAILASDEDEQYGAHALQEFQSAVEDLVKLYGDGSHVHPCGTKACGFDLDSKVQVFETNIRGVGGLLSAHLFAVGDLPIRGYSPAWVNIADGRKAIEWNGFAYDGQLLRLAHDLASRLLPAFSTATGLPYPRVNLRHGISFYQDGESGFCRPDGTSTSASSELTETCSAGAGSLVLEFSTLSRLTGDDRFEKLAKRAFFAIWSRRSSIGLLGNGIDAENGQWSVPSLSGIGAGIDSFFEYAFKSHILLSGVHSTEVKNGSSDADTFLATWNSAHDAVKRHIYRPRSSEKHPFYAQSDLATGAPRYGWIDNLSAFYPGLLVLAGELDEAVETHMLYAALWTRYSALPERWHTFNGYIDPNFKHWPGRPEFIESTYYIYQATKDPWYLHVGEMALRDIRRRCWTKCGWADLRDIVSGEQRDRMESFFLGETAKYLFLLFSSDHPLNKMDAPVVFSTEGHPLIIPKAARHMSVATRSSVTDTTSNPPQPMSCSPAPQPLPLTSSNTANRSDLFHAASLAQLHLVPVNPSRSSPLVQASDDGPAISQADIQSPTNYTFYPWTLPRSIIPAMATSLPIPDPILSTLTFPNLSPEENPASEKGFIQIGALQKVVDGVLIKSLSNVRLNMVQEPKTLLFPGDGDAMIQIDIGHEYRIHGIANLALGRDEKVLLSTEALEGVSPTDPHFTRMKDPEMVDLLVDIPAAAMEDVVVEYDAKEPVNGTMASLWDDLDHMLSGLVSSETRPATGSAPQGASFSPGMVASGSSHLIRHTIPAILPTGIGTAPLPSIAETPNGIGSLPFTSVFFLKSQLCSEQLPTAVAKSYQILILMRGGCSFGEKLNNIPSFVPTDEALRLVIVISLPEAESSHTSSEFVRPLLDEHQITPTGLQRRNPLAMVMVAGNSDHLRWLTRVSTALGQFDAKTGELLEERKRMQSAIPRSSSSSSSLLPGLGVKSRYWFESMGIPISNLIMA